MSDINPAAVMAAHERHPYGSCSVTVLREMQSELNHCEPYRLAEALTEALRRGDYTALAESLELAERERDKAREALAAEQAKVARVEAAVLRYYGEPHPTSALRSGLEFHLRAALADQPDQE